MCLCIYIYIYALFFCSLHLVSRFFFLSHNIIISAHLPHTIYISAHARIRDAIKQKMAEYIGRAEQIKKALDASEQASAGGGAASATKARPKAANGGGGGGGEGAEDGEDPELARLRASLSGVVLTEKPNVTWDDVAGLDAAKDALKEAVILPVRFPQFFTGKRKPWNGFLLYGPPGTGKSYLAKAVATEADSTFFSVSSSDLVSKWMGESEKLVSQLFQMARASAPSIIFIDEVDSLCSARGEGESEAARRIKTEFLVQMQGVGHEGQGKVLILGATNMPYQLDQAVRRRFDKRIYIPLPEADARAGMFKIHLGSTPHTMTDADFRALADKTEGFSGSDIAVCVKDVLFEPVRKTQDACFFRWDKRVNVGMSPGGPGAEDDDVLVPCSGGDRGAFEATLTTLPAEHASKVMPPGINFRDFEKVLLRARPTVSEDDLKVYERFTAEFGEEGS